MENLFYQPEIINGIHYLNEVESKHCQKVLRKKSGDSILVTDGLGRIYNSIITKSTATQIHFSIQLTKEVQKKDYSIHLAISPTKNQDRIEWMVEKCVELGIDKITLLNCMNTEKKGFNISRLEKIAISAMKQSQRAWLPKISPLTPVLEFISNTPLNVLRYIAYVDLSNPDYLLNVAIPGNQYVILIGPEGDFSEAELQHAIKYNFLKVSLGDSRLRTETAGLAACHILNLVNQS